MGMPGVGKAVSLASLLSMIDHRQNPGLPFVKAGFLLSFHFTLSLPLAHQDPFFWPPVKCWGKETTPLGCPLDQSRAHIPPDPEDAYLNLGVLYGLA